MCNLSASTIFLYIEGVNGIKKQNPKIGWFCVNESGLWLMVAW